MPKDQNQKPSKQTNNLDESQSKILKNLSARLTDDYFERKNFPLRNSLNSKGNDRENLEDYIKKSAKKLAEPHSDDLEDMQQETPLKFDGVKGVDEERTILREELKHLERENLKLKHQLDLLKNDYDAEKKHLHSTIRDLKSELHRTAPLTESKFFSFSKDLRDVVDSVRSLTDEELVEDNISGSDLHTDVFGEITPPPVVTIQSPLESIKKNNEEVKVISNQKLEDSDKVAQDQQVKSSQPKSAKIKKIIGISTVVALITFSLGALLLKQKPTIDQGLVDSYLEQNGQVKGVNLDSNPTASPSPTTIRKEFKNEEATFEETEWEVFRDEFLGFQVEYPGNVTDLLHTGNTITFLRKDGYLFKMQRIQSKLSAEEYWDEVKDQGLAYKVESKKIGIHPAIHLILDEAVEFPGNRYIVKINEHIFDIWYATKNPAFDDADLKRVDRMLEKMRFL